jgi:cytoskeletal protein CcmA (bactofilin family)
VHLTNNCRISGAIYAGGTLTMDSTQQVLGSVSAVGNVRFQSSAKIGGSVSTSGTFTVIDGLSQQALAAMGAITGTISTGITVPQPSVAPYQIYTVGTLPASAITWKQWMNQNATANAAPSWSPGLTSNPGCTMAPWSSSVNGSTVFTSGDLVVDARSQASACAGVALQQMTLSLGGNLTLLVGKFDAINGLNVVSRDGAAHTLTVKVEGASGSTNKDLTFSAGTTIDPKIKVALQTPGKVTVNGTSSLGASIQASAFATSGAVNFG